MLVRCPKSSTRISLGQICVVVSDVGRQAERQAGYMEEDMFLIEVIPGQFEWDFGLSLL